jgi:hypothetical protein
MKATNSRAAKQALPVMLVGCAHGNSYFSMRPMGREISGIPRLASELEHPAAERFLRWHPIRGCGFPAHTSGYSMDSAWQADQS